ncbi:hypothetical protein GO495_02930 [Chitinophaga oryziterrae]|uniref:Uncharacterized protein n=1 Tax=Chitinophaga oryziterrae TaxID=1031224 RepID=A0A6N8J5N7_9BACT|nr:hypothetical protein [Chitinophaga oryziterrae]MVT39529.1 hypothetical protein [Chitinophaga oryziterrae]
MKKNYLKNITIGLGLAAFLIGVSISFSSYGSANAATAAVTAPCYTPNYSMTCPAQTTATVTITGSSSQTVALTPTANGGFKISLFGQEITIPVGSGKTTTTVTDSNGSTYTVTITIGSSYQIVCKTATSGGQACATIDCKGNNLQTYTCADPGTSTSSSVTTIF